MKLKLFYLALISVLISVANGQNATVGVIQHNAGSLDDGFILFAPDESTVTYLIDKCGRLVHNWTSSYMPGWSVYLLPDGNLLRAGRVNNPSFNYGGSGGIIELLDWNSNVLWSYVISDNNKVQHHDIKPLPNGHIMAVVWEKKTSAQAIAAGRNTAYAGNGMLDETLLELQPVGSDSANIVWQWHAWDHLVQHYSSSQGNYGIIAGNPQLLNLNNPPLSSSPDWIHLNDVDYNPDLDQLMVSGLYFSEIWIIDHSTTAAQAAGHTGGNSGKGGDILYRWGNPAAYGHGTITNRKIFHVHDANWIKPGLPDANNILFFNNGVGRPSGNYSTVEIIDPPVDSIGNYSGTLPYSPDSSFWIYKAPVPTSFYAPSMSGAQQLPNGNILICNATIGEFFEVTSAKTQVWKYINPVGLSTIYSQGTTPSGNDVFRCTYYPATYSGFNGHTLLPGSPIELNPLPDTCNFITKQPEINKKMNIAVFPDPASDFINIMTDCSNYTVMFYNIVGQKIYNAVNTKQIMLKEFPAGVYILSIISDKGKYFNKKIVISR